MLNGETGQSPPYIEFAMEALVLLLSKHCTLRLQLVLFQDKSNARPPKSVALFFLQRSKDKGPKNLVSEDTHRFIIFLI